MAEETPRYGLRHQYVLVRRQYRDANIFYHSRVLIDGTRPGLVVGVQGCNYVYVELQDRIDRAQIRVPIKRLTFLDSYTPRHEPDTDKKRQRLKNQAKVEQKKRLRDSDNLGNIWL